jgi:hypothetical protein
VAGASVGTTVTVAGGGVLVVVFAIIACVLLPAFWRYQAPVTG